MRHVVAVSHIRERDLSQIAIALLQREIIRQRLARMLQIAQRIDHRNRRVMRHVRDRFMRERAQHNHVDPALEVVRNVAQRFARIQPALRLIHKHRGSAQAAIPASNVKPRAQRGLLKKHHHLFARQRPLKHRRPRLHQLRQMQHRLNSLRSRDRASIPSRGTRTCREKFPASPPFCFVMDYSTLDSSFCNFLFPRSCNCLLRRLLPHAAGHFRSTTFSFVR
jgi:hypothetical protein